MHCSTENQDDVTATTSLTDALASVQDIATRSTEDDIYSVVSDHSIDDLGLHTSCPDNQTPHALPYEVAVFQGQSLSDDTQALQYTTDSKAVLQPYDEVDHNKQNQQYRENQTFPHINDEHHMYDEVKHEAKVGQRKLIMSAVNDTRERESITASELFDDMVYEGRNVTLHAMCNTSMDGYDYAEPTATKKQRDQFRFAIHDEHLYDSVDQLRKGQMATLTTNSGDNDNINGEPDGTKHIYHSLETGTHGRVTNPESYNMPIGYQSTTLQDINSQSGDCDPTLYNCQFDDPMYESNPHPGGDLKVIATPSSMKADVTELQEDELTMQGNPELLINYSGDAENYCNTDTPQHTDLASESNTITMESQDKADRNLASIYDMFDDPTYGVCHTGSNKK